MSETISGQGPSETEVNEEEDYSKYEFIGVDPEEGKELIRYSEELDKLNKQRLDATMASDDQDSLDILILSLKINLARYAGIFDPTNLEMKKLIEYYRQFEPMSEEQKELATTNNRMEDPYKEAVYQLVNDYGHLVRHEGSIPLQYVLADGTDKKVFAIEGSKEFYNKLNELDEQKHTIKTTNMFPPYRFINFMHQVREDATLP